MKAIFKTETKEGVFPGGTVGGQWGWSLIETDGLGTPEIPGINPPPGVKPPIVTDPVPEQPEVPGTKPPQKPTKPDKPVTTPVEPEDGASIQPVVTAVDAEGERVVWQSTEAFTSIEVDAEVTYKVSVVRLDADSNPLGAPVSAIFTTEANPEEVVIQIAGTLTVEVVA